MEVEVKQPEGFYLKAIVTDVLEDSLDVSYEQACRKPENVDFSKCRAVVIENVPKRQFKSGDLVDAFVRIDKNDADELRAYMKMKIRDIKADFAVLQSADTDGTQVSDIIPLDQCRHPALASQITADSVKSYAVDVSDELCSYFTHGVDTFKMLQEHVPKIHLKFDPDAKQIIVKSFSIKPLKQVQILQDTFMLHSKQKMQLLNRHQETKKMLAATEPPDEFVEEFKVETGMMGLAIGSQGTNIGNARKLDGVKDIVVDESQRTQGFCKIKREVDPAQQKKIDLMRMDVRKAIETSLQKRCKTANMNFSMKRYKDLGLDIERVLFANHQDVNVKYRKWFKTFMTVVNDEKNAYFKEVMRDKVSVKRLVTLNEEQMQVAVPVAVLAAADSTSSENANVISAASSSAFVRPVNVNKRPAVHGKSAVDEILGESTSDTTLLHTTHLFDANCEICKKDQAKKQAMRKRAEERESMLDAQVKRQQLQQGKPFFPNMDPSIMSAMIDTNMPAGGDPPSRHLRTGASDFDAPLSSLDPAIRAAMMDTNMPMPACGTSMLPPSRHHRTASRDFDPPLSSAVGGPTTPLDTGYDPEHDPLGLNTVQVGDPVMEENGNAVVEQQHRLDIDDDAAFGFGAGGAFDDDDFGGDEGGTFNNVGKGNVIQRQAFPPRRSSPTPAFSNCGFDGDGLQRHPPRRATPTPAFSNCGFGGGDDNRDTGRQFQQAHQQRASPPPNFSSNANLEPLGSVRRFPRFEKTTQEADTEQQHQQENSVFVAEPTTSFGSDEQQLQHRHLSPAAFVRSQRVALQQAAECTPHRTLYNESWKERGRQQQQQQRPHLLQDTEPPTEINETSPCFGEEADTDPWKTMSLLVWRGLFVWNRQTFFNCTCTAVSGGRAVFKAGREMVGDGGGGGDAGRIHLIGRSESRGVWEYVLQLRDSWNKQVCLMIINRPEDEHDFVTYVNCFERYNQGTQVGVLDFADHPTIKDGYVFTLSAGEALPAVLLPLDGVGLPEWTKHNGSIVLMLIRRMDHEDKQWKRRMGCDVSWRRVGTDAVEQQQPPLNIPLTPFASGAADDRMVRVLSDPRLDQDLTTRMGSRLYRYSRLFKCMPLIFHQIIAGLNTSNENDEDERVGGE